MTFPEINVAGVGPADGTSSVFEAIQHALPVRFATAAEAPATPDPELVLSYSSGRAGKRIARRFHVARGSEGFGVGPGQVSFSNHPVLHACLRGRTIPHASLPKCVPLRPEPGDIVLATARGIPVWTARMRDEAVDEYTGVPLPGFSGQLAVIDFLNGQNFMPLLPLVHFVRRALADDGWKFPPPRASFMFDDPNLHRTSYGFISYPEIVRRSEAVGYHVAFATVPFDTWYTSSKAADAFRSHPDRISLLLHGNDHTYAELARLRSPGMDRQVAAQAVTRISRFEQRTGVRVRRTMAAPHGACSNEMMAAMLDVGIEGLFCSPWSLRLWDPSRAWTPLGLRPAEIVGGFPVFPRFRFSSGCDGSAALCSLLGQPIVPVGHHQDLRDGADLLDHIAQGINGIPNVTWGDTESLARSNYITRIRPGDQVMHVIPYSTSIRIRIPEGISSVSLHEAGELTAGPARHCWVAKRTAGNWNDFSAPGDLPASPGDELAFRLAALGAIASSDIPHPQHSVSAPIRRLLCESRDRIEPIVWSINHRIRRSLRIPPRSRTPALQ